MERAAASGHAAALTDIDAPIVASICRRLDGDHRRDALTIGAPRALCVRRFRDESESHDDGCNRPQQFLQIFFTVRSTLVFS
jgi:hypothetical protein